jgi:hypothetical protein
LAGKGKAKAKAKATALVDEKGKARRKVVNGKKLCPCCNKMLPIEQFPVGSGNCGTDKKAIQNLVYTAKTQGKESWMKEQMEDPVKLRKLVQAYKDKCLDEI